VLVLNNPTVDDNALTLCDCFPNVRHLREDVLLDGIHYVHDHAMTPSCLSAFCKHFTGLQRLVLTAECSSLDPDVSELDRIAAIRSLTQLQHLTNLSFTPFGSVEFLALIQSCCILEEHSLSELHVSDSYEVSVSTAAWTQLAALRRLRN
jgi:hypothetical protein